MTIRRELAVNIAACTPVTLRGRFQRHSSPNWPPLTGSASGGRWGRPGAYSVLYLGRPEASVVVEAYRHLVDDIEGMRPDLVQPRRVVTCQVSVTNLLDLRVAENRIRVGLTEKDLRSPIGDYDACQQIGAVAHQLYTEWSLLQHPSTATPLRCSSSGSPPTSCLFRSATVWSGTACLQIHVDRI